MDELIVCSKLTKRYRRLIAVNGLGLTVGRGEVFGFLGPNGAGKSTTLRMMVGLVRPTSGSVRLFGYDVRRDGARALKRVGALIESASFYKYLSGRDNLRILSNMGADHSKSEIDEALDTVGLADRANDKVKSYSQGMRQRLGIALAILGKPELVLLDEPTNGLDPEGMREVRELIKKLSTEFGMTVFLSSHLLHEVEQICTRIAVVNKGRVIETGRVADLLSGSEAIRIRVTNPEQAVDALRALDWVKIGSVDEKDIRVSLTGGCSADLNRFLVEKGFDVSALVPERRSLEELYLRLMGGESC